MGIWKNYWDRRLSGQWEGPTFRARWSGEGAPGLIHATSDHPLFRDYMWSWNGGNGVRIWYQGRAFAWLDMNYGGLYEISPSFVDGREFEMFLELIYERARSAKDVRKVRHFKPDQDEEAMRNDREAPTDQEPDFWDKDFVSSISIPISVSNEEDDSDSLRNLTDDFVEMEDLEFEEDWEEEDIEADEDFADEDVSEEINDE